MRHCRQCRADAVGLLGEDRSEEFTLDKIEQMDVVYDLDKRRAYQQSVEVERQAQHAAKTAALSSAAAADDGVDPAMKVLVAVATEGQGKVNQHFGHATEFQIFELSQHQALFVGHRRVDLYCQGGWGEEETLPSVVNAINDCHAVLVAKIGACPRDELAAAGIEPVDQYAHEFIESAALAWFADYRQRIARGDITHQVRGDASIRQGAYTSGTEAA
jgi:nitrogen fixation protein NifB